MTLTKTSIGRMVLLGAFAALASVAAAQAQSPALLVVHQGENTLSIVDPKTGKVMGRVPTVDHGHSVTASGDGKMAYVVNFSKGGRAGNSISVVDLAARKEMRRIDLGSLTYPHGMRLVGGNVLHRAGQQGGCAIRPGNQQGRLDARHRPDGTHNLVVSNDGNRIFTANVGSNSVTAFERNTGKFVSNGAGDWNITVIPIGPEPQAIDMSPDGTEVWAAAGRDGTVSIIDAATKKVKQTLNLPAKGFNHLQFTPDGRRVVVSHMRAGELVVLDAPRGKRSSESRWGAV